jgi:hypothetical protein
LQALRLPETSNSAAFLMLRQIGTSLLEADESFVLTADRDDVVVVWRGEVLQRANESSISLILHADIGQVLMKRISTVATYVLASEPVLGSFFVLAQSALQVLRRAESQAHFETNIAK